MLLARIYATLRDSAAGRKQLEQLFVLCWFAGKSLDKIMELKEIAGDRDLYDVMKKQKKKHKTGAKTSKGKDRPKCGSVFDFINKKLGSKKGWPFPVLHVARLVEFRGWGGRERGEGGRLLKRLIVYKGSWVT